MQVDKLTRTLGDSNLSIGTHLGMESLFWNYIKLYDEEREIDKQDINNYSLHLFNIFTLLRNVLNSIDYNDKIHLMSDVKTISSYLLDEVYTLIHMYKEFGFKVIVYFPDYSKVIKNFNVGKEYPSVVLWQLYQMMNGFLLELLKDKTKYPEIVFTDHRLPEIKELKPYLLTTSFGVDLLNKGNYLLLESHTGKVLGREHFGKKSHSIGKNDLTHLPMIPQLYYILGDTGLVKPFDFKTRRTVYELSIANHWTYRTSPSRVNFDLKKNEITRYILNNFKNIY